MEGLKEALAFLGNQAVEAMEPKPVKVPSDAPHVHRFIKPDGDVLVVESDRPPINFGVHTLAGLLETAENQLDLGECAVHIGSERITVQHHVTRERVWLTLRKSPEVTFFENLRDKPVVEARGFRKALLYDLTDTRVDSREFADIVANMTWRGGESTTHSAGRNAESMDQNVIAEAQAAGDMPDHLQTFDLRPFYNIDMPWRHPLTCIFDPEPNNQGWVLYPAPESWLSFQARAFQSLSDFVSAAFKDKCRVVHGTPNIG